MDSISSRPAKVPGSVSTPLVISMAGVVSTALILVLYHLVFVKYCLRRSRQRNRVLQRNPNNGQMNVGVEKKVLDTIPVLFYSTNKGELFRVDQCECVVCLGELEDGDMVRLLPHCRHAFHVTCIDVWFLAHTSCPICRSPILEPVTIVSPMMSPPANGQENNGVDHNYESSRMISCSTNVGLRHCLSSVFPMEEEKRHSLTTSLKRSLSDDQSYVLISIEREGERAASSSSSHNSSKDGITSNRRLLRERYLGQFDGVSSILLRSFSRLRSTSDSNTNGVLPY